MDLDKDRYFSEARAIFSVYGADAACRHLASLRKSAAMRLCKDENALNTVLEVVRRQCEFLLEEAYASSDTVNDEVSEKVEQMSAWALAQTHFCGADNIDEAWKACSKFRARESTSRLYLALAKSRLRAERWDGATEALRAGLDLTHYIEEAILSVFASLEKKRRSCASDIWFSDRYAEFLAQLDFAGLGKGDFRRVLDDIQFAVRTGACDISDEALSENAALLRQIYVKFAGDDAEANDECDRATKD